LLVITLFQLVNEAFISCKNDYSLCIICSELFNNNNNCSDVLIKTHHCDFQHEINIGFIMKNIFYSILIGFFLVACNNQTETTSEVSKVSTKTSIETPVNKSATETERLNEWFEAKYEEELSFSPIELTMIGRQDRYDEIDDFSEQAYTDQVAWKAESVEEMQANFDYNALTDDGKLSWDLWEYQNQQTIAQYKNRTKNYLFHQMTGVHSFLPTFMISFHKVETLEDMQAYISRLTGVGTGIGELVKAAKHNASTGTRPPRFAYEIVKDQAKKILNGKPFTDSEIDAPLLADAKTKIAVLLTAETINQEQADELIVATEAALINGLKPGYDKLITFLDEDITNTGEEAHGVGALPDGDDYYNYRLKRMTTTDMSADEIHELGVKEVERLRAEMDALKIKSGFEGDLQDFFTLLRDSKDDDRFYFKTSEEGAQGYIDEAAAAIENIKSELPNYFGILPKADLVVQRVESFREQDGAPQHYFSGTPDGSRPGIYYAHLSDMGAMPKFQLEVIAYHEGLPGHHMQISIAQELEGVPTFRTQAGFTAYSEGWGLYSELLAKEMTNTYTDVYSDFGRLTSEVWRAIRLVVDTGLHAKGWTQQQAVDYFAANSPAPIPAIEAEIRRYLVMPGQATSYKIGMLDILRLRKIAETELGDSFDIKQFHDVVLGGGALPLSLLDRQVMQWISKTKESG